MSWKEKCIYNFFKEYAQMDKGWINLYATYAILDKTLSIPDNIRNEDYCNLFCLITEKNFNSILVIHINRRASAYTSGFLVN